MVKPMALVGSLLCSFLVASAAPKPWPGDAGVNIDKTFDSGWETSGSTWHSRLRQLFVVHDNGAISRMDLDGSNRFTWTTSVKGLDIESIAVADPTTNNVYLAIEQVSGTRRRQIKEFNIVSGLVTRTFELAEMNYGDVNLGMESLTFVPDSGAEGGTFFCGHQSDGSIHKYVLPLRSSLLSTSVGYKGKIVPTTKYRDIAGMEYHPGQNALYASYDGAERILKMTVGGVVLEEWYQPPTGAKDQEGIAIVGDALVLTDDITNAGTWRYVFPPTR